MRAERRLDAKVAEVPIIFIERLYGESKLSWWQYYCAYFVSGAHEVFRYISGLLKLFWSL